MADGSGATPPISRALSQPGTQAPGGGAVVSAELVGFGADADVAWFSFCLRDGAGPDGSLPLALTVHGVVALHISLTHIERTQQLENAVSMRRSAALGSDQPWRGGPAHPRRSRAY